MITQPSAGGRVAARSRDSKQLDRTAFRTSRLMEYLSRKELVAQIGHPVSAWPLVVVKELMDNALDACEEAGVPPAVSVSVDEGGITVRDNGPGIPADVVADACDFAVRVSSREAYVSPTRGAQGNALKGILAIPFVLDCEQGRVDISAGGTRHEITIRVDRIRQRPVIDRRQKKEGVVKNGTLVRVRWPDSPRSSEPPDGPDLEENDPGADDSPRSILAAAKARFLQIADDFTFLNPHLTLALDWHGERSRVQASEPGWKKWGPRDPTSPHWYGEEHLERLIAGYVAHDADLGRDRTVRELVAEFRGLTGTAKQKAVLEECGQARTSLAGLAKGEAIDRATVAKLLRAMRKHSKPVKPAALGLVGKAHLESRFAALGCEMESFEYRKVLGERDGVPWVVETAFGWSPNWTARRIVTGVNWSPGILNPFRELGKWGRSLDSILEAQRAGEEEPIALVLHMACPRVEFGDRGKSSVIIEG
jgi:hypothetical protein